MAPIKTKERLLKLIECPACLKELDNPRLLMCGHTLCLKCLKNYADINNHVKQLPCPVCKQVTHLYQGDVDNLPNFCFVKTLKEVIVAEDDGAKPEPEFDVVCSTDGCKKSVVKYCTQGCEFLCKACFNDHQSIRFTKSHHVITAREGDAMMKAKIPPYPLCNQHKSHLMDLYCRTCNTPICNSCSKTNHKSHDRCKLDKQAEACKVELERISEDTDVLITAVKTAIDKTKCHVRNAKTYIDDVCKKVKSTFEKMHKKLEKEEKKMLGDLMKSRKRVKKTADGITENQTTTLGSLQTTRYHQAKLAAKGTVYDYVTTTGSIHRDLACHFGKDLPSFSWDSQFQMKSKAGESVLSWRVDVTETEIVNKKALEVRRFRLHTQDHNGISGLVVYNQHTYTVNHKGLYIYCYTPDGSLLDKHEYNTGTIIDVQGMCLVKDDVGAMLVVSDATNKQLVWIRITPQFTMVFDHTDQLDYTPCGVYSGGQGVMVCDPVDHSIHCYGIDDNPQAVITLPDDFIPRRITRHGDKEQFIVTDSWNHHLAVITRTGEVKMRYKDEVHGVEVGELGDVIIDTDGKILIADIIQQQVLVLSRDGDDVRRLLQQQHVISPYCICLDSHHHRLYVSGRDQDNTRHVFVYDYALLMGDKTFTEKTTELNMAVEM